MDPEDWLLDRSSTMQQHLERAAEDWLLHLGGPPHQFWHMWGDNLVKWDEEPFRNWVWIYCIAWIWSHSMRLLSSIFEQRSVSLLQLVQYATCLFPSFILLLFLLCLTHWAHRAIRMQLLTQYANRLLSTFSRKDTTELSKLYDKSLQI